ncbi:hypothetical protein TUM20985_55870 [Mycobacterium antarcticum]|uniref:hypothetical protein n=1 Tax=unclassified Mycolicibacterium TaxID=2636767 RepID=UPI00239B9C5C|nr:MULTISPECIES: hypothetical protein [unclassified Mycolicibacterium]BDX35040.1 hypothetical protein TUM20985_55870 [Mycolicibacterium sp. TUM20985]GLP81319.1 hypothetical protein TUM20984_27390 [Mycolicibacterium sp. TUM20984]
MPSRRATKSDSRLAGRLAAIASLGAGVIHLAVVPTHWQEWLPSGLFFVSIAVFQLIWARMVLARPTTPVLAAGIAANVCAVAIWAMSRTAGAPFGPHAGKPELVHAADLCALLLQIYVVMGAGWVWYRGHRPEPIPAYANTIVLLGGGAFIALASAVGVASGLSHGHHAPAEAGPDHHGTSTEQVHQHSGDPAPAISPTMIAPQPPAQPLRDAHGDHHHDE